MSLERASYVAMKYFTFIGKIPGGRFLNRLIHNNHSSGLEREVFGLQFYNPLGLGAGLDIHGELYNDLNDLGFSFVVIGPLNATTVLNAVHNLQKDPSNDIIAAGIDRDHQKVFSLAYDFCDFFVIDIGLEPISDIMGPILDTRLAYGGWKPVVVKIPESMSEIELDRLIDYCRMNNVDGIVARSTDQIKQISFRSQGRLPVIAECHAASVRALFKALSAGACLVEVGSGLIYRGPYYIQKCLKFLNKRAKNEKSRQEISED